MSFNKVKSKLAKLALYTVIIFLTLQFSEKVIARTIFIDYLDGQDTNTGQAKNSAWKHAPGDPNASDKATNFKVKSGDILMFKGGVTYEGGLILKASGTQHKKIVYKGNGWGPDPAIISGAENIGVKLKKCLSALDCYDHPHWEHLLKGKLNSQINPVTPIYLGAERLWLARYPNQKDPFWFDKIDEYAVIEKGSSDTSLTSEYLDYGDTLEPNIGEHWDGVFVAIWMKANRVLLRQVINVDTSQKRLYFEPVKNKPYTKRNSYFAIFNRPSDIDQPGEFIINNETIVIWPPSNGFEIENTLSKSSRIPGFDLNGQSNIKIEGFKIQRFFGTIDDKKAGAGIVNRKGPSKNIVVADNLITDLKSLAGIGAIELHQVKNVIISNNAIYNNQKNSGVRFGRSSDITIVGNLISRVGRTGIRLIGTEKVLIAENEISEIRGNHGNAISIYVKNKDILVASNIITNSPRAFTYHGNGNPNEAKNLWLLNNIFYGRVNSWGRKFSSVFMLNNLFFAPDKRGAALGIPAGEPSLVVENNIIDGLLSKKRPPQWNFKNNVYTSLSWRQRHKSGWNFDSSEIIDTALEPKVEDFTGAHEAPPRPTGGNIYHLLPIELFQSFDFDPWKKDRPIGPEVSFEK